MKSRHLLLAGAVMAALGWNAAIAAPAENWIGAWGYTAMPLPPGLTPAPANPPLPPVVTPLGAAAPAPVVTARNPAPRTAPLLDNPGNVPMAAGGRDSPPPANITVRQLVDVAAAGKRVRLRFSNEDGSDVLVLGAVHVGLAGANGAVIAGTDHAVTFDGHAGVTIPSSAPLLSDPIDLPVKALDRLLISIHVPGTVPRGGHSLYQYVSGTPGDQTAQATLPDIHIARVTSLVTEVDVDATTATNVVVALGDSITEGFGSTANAFRGWPDLLAKKLAATSAGRKWSVVNAGIGGNRLLRYGTGPNILARFDRDVLAVPGVKAVILLEGINDIGHAFPAPAAEPVTAEALEAADKQIIARAHDHGIKVIGATLTPYEGAPYYDPKGEEVRKALNQWIMTSGAFDGVVDFAAAVADPAHPDAIRANFNLRDHLHPNDDGYQAMTDAIDLKLITGK